MEDLGLLVLRLVIGLLLAGHGAQKLFGAFGGPGLAGTTGWLGSLGLRPAGYWALLAGLAEFGGGLLVAFGFLTPLGAVAVAGAMLTAALLAHRQALWIAQGGMEYNLVLIAAALALVLTGPGRLSLDAAWGLAVPPALTALAAALALLSAGLALGMRRGKANAVAPTPGD